MLVLQGERAKKDLPRVVIVVPELCSISTPKPATNVMQEHIVVAQTVTLVLIVQLDTKTMLQKVDHVCPVFLDKNNPLQVKHPATIVPLIRSVKVHPRPNAMLVLREERAKKDLPRAVIVVPELCSISTPKPATNVMQEH